MFEQAVYVIAEAFAGERWQIAGCIWLASLKVRRRNLVVFSGDSVCENTEQKAFEASRATRTIVLA